ncbi:MAG: hypothetical protein HYV27_21470 [Candidatus Hydrogenedentes bacterium]|nr:hypothetical protein [Candidatus Hydrogenedentota bacterium]
MPWQRRTRRWMWIVLVFTGTPLLAWLIFRSYAAGQEREALAKLAPYGYRGSMDVVRELYPPPTPQENGMALFAAAFQKLQPATPKEAGIIPFLGVEVKNLSVLPALDERSLEKANSVLARNADALGLVEEALMQARMPAAVDMQAPWALYEVLDRMKQLIALLELRAVVALQQQDYPAFNHDLELLLRYYVHLTRLPLFRSAHMVGSQFSDHARPLVQHALARQCMPADRLLRMEMLLNEADFASACRKYLVLQTAYRLGESFVPRVFLQLWEGSGIRDIQRARAMDFAAPLFQIKQKDIQFWWAELGSTNALHLDRQEFSLANALRNDLGQDQKEQLKAEMLIEVMLRALGATMAVERYRLDRGTLPTDLHALVPEYCPNIPIDPIDREPLRYLASPEGFVVYGIGCDGKDGQGSLLEEKTFKYDSGDWPVRVTWARQTGAIP